MEHKIVAITALGRRLPTVCYVYVCGENKIDPFNCLDGRYAFASIELDWLAAAEDNSRTSIFKWRENKYKIPVELKIYKESRYWNSFCPVCSTRVLTNKEQELIDTILRMGGKGAVHEYLKKDIILETTKP